MTDHKTYELLFDPFDTLHFSDGKPFHQQDEGLSESASIFPPLPHVISGAIRSLFAQLLGWEPSSGRWSKESRYGQILGATPWETGLFRVGALSLVLCDTQNKILTRWYPMPRMIGARQNDLDNLEFFSFVPRTPNFKSDQDLDLVFSLPSEDRSKPIDLTKTWLREDAFTAFSQGSVGIGSEHVLDEDDFLSREPRVGIALDATSKAAIKGNLYQATHLRFPSSLELTRSKKNLKGRPLIAVKIAVSSEAPELVQLLDKNADPISVGLGGRGKVATVTILPSHPVEDGNNNFQQLMLSSHLQFFIHATSPVTLQTTSATSLNLSHPFLHEIGDEISVRAAITDRPKRFALWNGHRHDIWSWFLPSGASYFIKANSISGRNVFLQNLSKNGLNLVLPHHQGGALGAEQAFKLGFGHFAITLDPDNQEA